MKKFLLIALSVMMLVLMAGCQKAEPVNQSNNHNEVKPKQKIIGILMPQKDSPRWTKDGNNLKYEFEKRGYKVDMQNSDNNVEKQRSQLKYMIDNGADIIIVAAVDSGALADILVAAKEKLIPVIAYDRLIMNSDAVSFYVTFDNKAIGMFFGEFVEDTLGLKDGRGSFNVEFVGGSLDDNNAIIVNSGIFEVLYPYIENGQIKVPSGQISLSETNTYRWFSEEAYTRVTKLLINTYNGIKPDAIICSSDGLAEGAVKALDEQGYTVGVNWPIITGQDADISAIKNIIAGKQSMTLFKDTRVLSAKCAEMVIDIMEGKLPDINDNMTYDNGSIIVPSYLCQPVLVTKENFKEVLLDTGYYAAEDVGL
ncbi:MAG: sugar-binding protein [Selenomonadaceae bacterium]|nr:sugar-binding protein [Selenomonadaceae bacterium]